VESGGDQGVLLILMPNSAPAGPIKCTSSTHVLEHDYDLFGTLAAY
jgi:hypothetical protein